MDPDKHLGDLQDGLAYAVGTPRRIAVVSALAVISYILITLSSFPEYSVQVLQLDVRYLPEAISALSMNTYQSAGLLGLSLIGLYAVFTGVALVNLAVLLQTKGVSGLFGASSMTPGLVIGGCAGCGAGIIGLLGFTGALALLPYNGNLLRIGGLALLLVFLMRTGDPRTCSL